jgi:hypothetical protein
MTPHQSELYKRMALYFERKADEAAASDAPWAMGNLRTYQNFASKYWQKHYRALHAEELQRSIAFQEAGMDE